MFEGAKHQGDEFLFQIPKSDSLVPQPFLDALASLDFMLSLRQSVSDSPLSSIKASASTGLSELFCNLYFCTSTDMLTKKFDLTIFLSIKRA